MPVTRPDRRAVAAGAVGQGFVAHDFAVQVIAVLGEMYEKASRQEAANIAYEDARGLGTIMTVKLFDPPQYEPEQRIFGPPLDRDFSKLLSPKR